jgi:hypothetical protein
MNGVYCEDRISQTYYFRTSWTFHEGNSDLGVGPHLQALYTEKLCQAVCAIGVDFTRGESNLMPTKSGKEYTFRGAAVDRLGAIIPDFEGLKKQNGRQRILNPRRDI